jgi:RNA polymerase sigma factor (sigma-70 family)
MPPDNLDEILDWLNPDRELAADMYVQLRHDLAKMFEWRGCLDPEGLTDEVFDRVSRKVREVRPTYEGDPRHYFRAVANNVIKEDLKKIKTRISLEGVDRIQPETQVNDDTPNIEECLQSCLQALNSEQRELILAYYAKEKQAKIDHRSQLAKQLGISVETLRVKAYRIRGSLQKCIQNCLEGKA